MSITILEMEELQEMKENVRRSILALELCHRCERITECEPTLADDAPPVWLCRHCEGRPLDERAKRLRLIGG